MISTKLGKFIMPYDLRNSDGRLDASSVVGLSTAKEIITTKANMDSVSTTGYKLLPPHHFAYVPDTSRRGEKMSLGYNNTEQTFLVSSISVVFRTTDELNSDYLYMYFNRPEFDRYSRYNSWGSARETFSWDDMCDITIDLPPLSIQQKYVDVYNAMLANQRAYEQGLEDLKLTCDAYIENFKHDASKIALGDLVEEIDLRNTDGRISSVSGVNKDKQFMTSVANGADLTKYKMVQNGHFACNLMHVGRDVAVPVALHDSETPLIVSPAYLVFAIKDECVLPEYALMWLSRNETDRYAWFMCDTNVRSGMEKRRFYEIGIPIPEIKVQQYIVNIYTVYQLRREINEQLKSQIKDLCPILIKGSLEEAARV